MTNREIAQEISSRIGNSPVPFDSVYSIALQIYNELGGEATQFDSVYSILLEILPLVEGGGGGKAIEEVAELPEASENKDKLFRLDNGEKDVYAAKLLSSETTTTNRLPDEQQIDKGYIYDDCSGEYCYYKGSCTVVGSNGTFNGFLWINEGEYDIIVTTTDAEIVTINDNKLASDYPFIINDNVVTSEGEVYEASLDDGCYFIIPATYNAPEANQIGNAYMELGGNPYYYTGVKTYLNIDGVETLTYRWDWNDSGDITSFYTTKKASEMYFQNIDIHTLFCDWYFYWEDGTEFIIDEDNVMSDINIPQLNAPDSEQVGVAKIYDNRNDVYYICTESVNIYCDDGVEVPAYLWIAENPSAVEWSNIMSNAPSTCYSSVPIGIICNEDLYYDYDYERWTSVDGSSYVINALGTNINYGSDGQYEYKDLVKYQRTETTEEWGWQDILEGGSSLEAGENIEIADNKINAIGYKAGNKVTSSFTELPEMISEPYMDMTSQLPSTDLYFTGEAGSTQYTVSGQLIAMISSMVGMIAFQVGSGNIAKLLALDSTNNIVTLDKSLDNNNALSAAQMSKLYMIIDVQISGDAGATTYSYVDSTGGAFLSLTNVDTKIKIGDYALRTVTNITNNTITFDETLDVKNAVSNVKWMYSVNVNNKASGQASHAEGASTTASGRASHTEGASTTASGMYSHAEGTNTIASETASHAEGKDTEATGETSHAEGNETIASGDFSHAEGQVTSASGQASHAEGSYTITQNYTEHAEGIYNISHKASNNYGNVGNTQHSVGIGVRNAEKNAFEIMQNGDMYVLGVGGYQGTDTHVQDENIDSLQMYLSGMETYIEALERRIYNLEHPTTIE